MEENKKYRYIEEVYTDKYHTLKQAILIDTYLNDKSNGMYANELRASVNPNLNILLRRMYLTETYGEIKELTEKINEPLWGE